MRVSGSAAMTNVRAASARITCRRSMWIQLMREDSFPRRVITFRSVTGASPGSPAQGTSPGKWTEGELGRTVTSSRLSIDNRSSPASTASSRSTPGNTENGPPRVTLAMLMRQSKSAKPPPDGDATTSRVTPPPFLQGVSARPAALWMRITSSVFHISVNHTRCRGYGGLRADVDVRGRIGWILETRLRWQHDVTWQRESCG